MPVSVLSVFLCIGIITGVIVLFGTITKTVKIHHAIKQGISNVYSEEYASEFNLTDLKWKIKKVNSMGADVVVECNVDSDATYEDKDWIRREIENCIDDCKISNSFGYDKYVTVYINGELISEETLKQEIDGIKEYKKEDEYRDSVMSAQDWGDDYYYDAKDNKVKEYIW